MNARRTRTPDRSLLCVVALSLAACGGEPDEPRFTKLFTSDHFVYYVEEGVDPPCDGTREWIEHFYSVNAKFMGATLAPGARIEYHYAPNGFSGVCPADVSGCTFGTTIYSKQPAHAHEIVHANASLVGDAPALFSEGLAEVLSCGRTGDIGGAIDLSDPIESLVETAAFRGYKKIKYGPYGTSAVFVRYLIDRFGSSRFFSFYARAPSDGGRQEIEEAFQAEMGVRLDDAFSDWRTKPPPYFGDRCLRLMECDPSIPALAGHPAAGSGAGGDVEVALGCGPNAALPVLREAILRFEVPEDRIVHLTTEPVLSDPQSIPRVKFYRCGGGDVVGTGNATSGRVAGADGAFHVDPARPGAAFALDVPPGEYVAWFDANEIGVEARVRVDLAEQPSPMRSAACQAAEEPLALDDKHPTRLASRWIERPCQGPWCPGQSWDVSIGATGGALEVVSCGAEFSPGEIYICSDPCPEDASECEVLVLDPEGGRVQSKQIFEPGAVLHLGAPAAVYADRFVVQLRVAPQ